MATRRARVKLAPNLGLSRNKVKQEIQKSKVVVKSDTDNSDAEAISDIDVLSSRNNSVIGLDSVVANRNGHSDATNHLDDSKFTTKPANPAPDISTVSSLNKLVNSSTVFNILTSPAQSLPIVKGIDALDDNEASDWEDDQFTYKSVEVNENYEIYKSLEITPINPAIDHMCVENEATTTEKAVVPNTNGCESATPDSVSLVQANPPSGVPTQSNPNSPKIRLPLGKNKFKPNLNFDRRSRNSSGGTALPRATVPNGSPLPSAVVLRSRTISGSSTSSEPEVITGRAAPPHSPLLREAVTAPIAPKPARVRKITEGRSVGERSQFMRRKLDHKRKFMRGVPERGSMTMFDLIYYNPEYGQRMSVEDDDEKDADNPDDPGNENQRVPTGLDDAVPTAQPATPEPDPAEDDALPVPQVKVGLNGEIILDESSLQLETTEQKKAKDLLQQSPVVFENNKTSTNYGTWSKKRRHSDWSERETLRFYRALSVVGSDFSMMESIFKNRSRQELKLKFKKEEKLNNKMIDKCLNERGMYTDLDGLMENSEEEEDVEEEKGRGRKNRKTRPRRRYKNRGYYDSSSGGEDADVETSRSPARKRVRGDSREERQVVRIKRPQVIHRENNHQTIRPLNPRPEAISLSQLAQQAKQSGGVSGVQLSNGQVVPSTGPGVQLSSGVQFPPGLLAANPGLVGAKPGSLVVVASPNKSDPTSQLLHVYMVSAKNKERLERDRDRSSSPRTAGTSTHRSVSPSSALTLDPAVVRAVDRTRVVERARTVSESADHSRVRTVSEAGGDNNSWVVQRQVLPRTRQRTYSEGGMSVRGREGGQDLRTETIRQRFLSGTVRSVPDLPPPTTTTLLTPAPALTRSPLLPVAKKSKPEGPVSAV
eukprot:GFUD01044402.1.p1 GENE.GFUD01044402.1~~GFUD01044402.1.p1  ORF type:complete len:880 (+),score=305.46 GFUD01044402.1:604-3243(+)